MTSPFKNRCRNARSKLLVAALALAMLPCAAEALYEVVVENGTRTLPTGDRVAYALYLPKPTAALPQAPFPAVVLTHGFARSLQFHAANARFLAERGLVVLTPNLAGLLGGDPAQLRNIANTADHVRWLAARSDTPGDALEGLLDRTRIGLVGHSAGAAISFEAAVVRVFSDTPVAAVGLLDGVPWPRTILNGGRLPRMPFLSLRSEPGGCNANGNVTLLLGVMLFPTEDVRIIGGTHCDAENPTEILCSQLCGGTSAGPRALYQRLLYLFLRDALSGPRLNADTYRSVLGELIQAGQIEVLPSGAPLVQKDAEVPFPGAMSLVLGGALTVLGARNVRMRLRRPGSG